MTIGIDIRVLQEGSGGVFVYAKNLLSRLIPLASSHQIKLFANRHGRRNDELTDALSRAPHVELYQYRFPNKFLNLSFSALGQPKIDSLLRGVDVLFFPSMLYGAWSGRVKTVLTMHDLSFEIFPEFFTTRQRLWHRRLAPRRLCQRVDKIIAVSESTRQDLLDVYKLPSDKVQTVHSGIDGRFRLRRDSSYLTEIRQRFGLPDKKFILQTGTVEPRKNAAATLAAFVAWQKQFPQESGDYHLLFAGHRGWKSRGFYNSLAASPFRDKIHLIEEVKADDLPALYNLADIFVYPSFYEGFGFPPLEAAACGAPVVVGANSSLTEIIGDAGLLVDPYRADDLLTAIRALANDRALYESLRAKGLARAGEFKWEKTAKETLKALEETCT